MQGFYGDTALDLIKESVRTREAGTVLPYRADTIRAILSEIKHLHATLDKTMSARTAVSIVSMKRSKQCVLAYQRDRLNRLTNAWSFILI